MRIKLRPYHPSWVITFWGSGGMKSGFNKKGFDYVLDTIRRDPNIEVELVEEYDDICERCDRRVESETDSVWGSGSTCTTAQNEATVASVTEANRKLLELFGLEYGSVISLRDLVKLHAERLPDLGKSGIDQIAGPDCQERYAKGLAALMAM